MDFEQVKKVIKKYLERPDRDIAKLQEYAKKMNINNKVMRMVGYYEQAKTFEEDIICLSDFSVN